MDQARPDSVDLDITFWERRIYIWVSYRESSDTIIEKLTLTNKIMAAKNTLSRLKKEKERQHGTTRPT